MFDHYFLWINWVVARAKQSSSANLSTDIQLRKQYLLLFYKQLWFHKVWMCLHCIFQDRLHHQSNVNHLQQNVILLSAQGHCNSSAVCATFAKIVFIYRYKRPIICCCKVLSSLSSLRLSSTLPPPLAYPCWKHEDLCPIWIDRNTSYWMFSKEMGGEPRCSFCQNKIA